MSQEMSQEPVDVISFQNDAHGAAHDYVTGSPHLRHDVLRTKIETHLRTLVAETVAREGRCRILEVGAGHGTFTHVLLEAGARVTVTEASEASAAHLRGRYAGRDDVEVFFDSTGEDVFTRSDRFDAVVCASLLHHVPDYVTFVRRLSGLLDAGGWFYSAQDPTYYPRRTRASHLIGRGCYFVWRLGQGDLRRGLATRIRRARGTWSETEESDLVEYHFVRDGVDELALEHELGRWFGEVEVVTYWSTQSPLLQSVFQRTRLVTDFCLIARGRTDQPV